MEHLYNRIEELIWMIEEPNNKACLGLLNDNLDLMQTVQGSTNNHQAWTGGIIDHITEVMNIAVMLYRPMNHVRPLPFSLSDLLLVVFLHDIEKPWKYEFKDGELHHKSSMETKVDHQKFRMEKLTEYGIVLTPEQENGIEYAEGELSNYSNRHRTMGPLAAAAHMCDVASARIWFDYPLENKDSWSGAGRFRE